MLANCRLCPRRCGVNRLAGEYGYCRSGAKPRVARAALHHWEEPPISGWRGSGTVFFCGCSLRCVYCQNVEISTGLCVNESSDEFANVSTNEFANSFANELTGEFANRMSAKSSDGLGVMFSQPAKAENTLGFNKVVDEHRLAQIFLELEQLGAHNINLVTPTHYITSIIASIDEAREQGLSLPFVYNTSGYETLETIRMLDGFIDIYLTDFKYASTHLAQRYSQAKDYPQVAIAALKEMYEQVGTAVYTEYPNEDPIKDLGKNREIRESHESLSKSLGETQDKDLGKNGKNPDKRHEGLGKNSDKVLRKNHDEILGKNLGKNLDESLNVKLGVNSGVNSGEGVPLMTRGIIVRHLMLPGNLQDSKAVVRQIFAIAKNNICLSLMNQFTPLPSLLKDKRFSELHRQVSDDEYDELIDYALSLGITNSYMQEGGTVDASFIPSFDGTGL